MMQFYLSAASLKSKTSDVFTSITSYLSCVRFDQQTAVYHSDGMFISEYFVARSFVKCTELTSI